MKTAKRGKGSKDKGAGFENTVAKLLTNATGWKWVRTPLSGGWLHNKEFNVAGDLMCEKKVKLFVECKKEEAPLPGLHVLFESDNILHRWYDYHARKCDESSIPILVFSKNYFSILFYMKYIHFKSFSYEGIYLRCVDKTSTFVVGDFRRLVESKNFKEVIQGGGV